MISHEYKCIFIHIPRTAGTFIENLIIGKNWWEIEPETKHLIASVAKKKYYKYWDRYFKFSIVRNPYSRFVSMLKYSDFFFGEKDLLNLEMKQIQFYKKKFNHPYLIEIDTRFNSFKNFEINKYKKNQVYLNILDEEIDFIGKFENLDEDLDYVCKKINFNFWKFKSLFKINRQKSIKLNYNLETNIKKEIFSIHRNDFKHFGYSK